MRDRRSLPSAGARAGTGRDGRTDESAEPLLLCSALLRSCPAAATSAQRSAPLGRPALRGSGQHRWRGRRALRAHVRAPLRAGCGLPPPPPPRAQGWRSGWSRLWDGVRPAALSTPPPSAGAPSGDAEEEEDGEGARRRGEERGGETGSAFPAQVEKGRVPPPVPEYGMRGGGSGHGIV